MLRKWMNERSLQGKPVLHKTQWWRDRQEAQLYGKVISQIFEGLCWWREKWYYQRRHHKHIRACPQHTKTSSSLSDSTVLSLSDYLFQRAENECTEVHVCVLFCLCSVCVCKRGGWREGGFCCRGRVEGDKDSVSGKCTWIASHQLPICCEAAVTGEGLRGGLRQSRPAADGEENNFWCQ